MELSDGTTAVQSEGEKWEAVPTSYHMDCTVNEWNIITDTWVYTVFITPANYVDHCSLARTTY